MTGSAGFRPRRFAAWLGLCLRPAAPAAAQVLRPLVSFAPLPSFALDPVEDADRWTGSCARLSAGSAVSTSRHFGRSAGPTLGLEGGRI